MLNGLKPKESVTIIIMNKNFNFNHNYHSHCYLCHHAKGTISDYCDEAFKLGFKEYGVSDHGPLLPIWKNRMTFDEFTDIYLKELEINKEKYQGKMKVYKSLELEYYEEYDKWYYDYLNKYHLDYLVLGQHFVYKNGEIQETRKGIDHSWVVDNKNQVVKGIESGYFKVLAHPDYFVLIVTKFRFWYKELEEISREIIEACIKNDVYLEVNANGIRHKRIINEKGEEVYSYPCTEFWKIVSTYKDAKVIIGSDCHNVNQIKDKAIDDAIDFCNKLNIKLRERIEL